MNDPGWAALESAFAALGRVLLLLDSDFRVLRATGTLDAWVDMASHGVWDYLASVHICAEARARVGEPLRE